jgi:hypothetical protein
VKYGLSGVEGSGITAVGFLGWDSDWVWGKKDTCIDGLGYVRLVSTRNDTLPPF